MNNSRRAFLKTSALAVAGSSLMGNSLFAAQKPKELVGVQLYSIRDEMKKDPLGTLKQVAAMGYKNVEHANYVDRKFYGYAPKEFKKILDDLGLKMPSGHTVMSKKHWDETAKAFTDEWKYTVEDAAVLGQQFVISPSMHEGTRKNYDELIRFLEVFNKSGELCQKSGMKFGYHNHDFEFSEKLNDKTLYDIILQNTDPKLVMQQLDIGNMVGGGAKAMEILKKYPGRFESMHVKDEIKSASGHGGYESTVLGKGLVNPKEIVDWGRKSGGTIHFIIEQEAYQGQSPLEAVKENLQVMKKWGYVS
ncbi:sugar phosphate isomerase/epimerase family protein [Rhodocytophaga aerolata]|uniref:Sugar phosphate isomerase/epimerase family protein n=1 Tax=Rhodocytophaga aerolata TaxID=455078 RepID=A0ABT8RFN4_9BACT|nr:sugar phosphate isomerase/epimerase family protein [Rhodocytophaga aerolata]MDO1450506.1 sugar phosphate isomerase/epimerase family protein [Rhodocytophaga aerolata]